MLSKSKNEHQQKDSQDVKANKMNASNYAFRYKTEELPRFSLPERSSDPQVIYELIHDELEQDGQAVLNTATFLTTRMDSQAEKLIMENLYKNFADKDEYTATQVIHTRCVSILADLWHAPHEGEKCTAVGTAVGGSSEGIMLAGMALKWRWRQLRKEKGLDTSKPNIVFGANAQVALEKYARYFEVEGRLVPTSAHSKYVLDTEKAIELIDENTIGVMVIMGSTYNGVYESVEEMSHLLDKYQKKTGIDIPIHVDGASGGFVAPFASPKLRWDFRVPRVVSINTSGHKFGLCYPGVGWIMWRSKEYLPQQLIFELHYLGSTEYTFTLNFSRPSSFVIAQYYNFLRLGREGYTRIMNACLFNARKISKELSQSNVFTLVSEVHKTHHDGAHVDALPLVAFHFSDVFRQAHPGCSEAALSALLRFCGWIVPAYGLPHPHEAKQILRVVVKESMSADLAERLVRDITWSVNVLKEGGDSGVKVLELAGMRDSERERDDLMEGIDIDCAAAQRTFARPC